MPFIIKGCFICVICGNLTPIKDGLNLAAIGSAIVVQDLNLQLYEYN
jgi:hypothetical protein